MSRVLVVKRHECGAFMKRNNLRPITRYSSLNLRRSLGLCLLMVLVAGMWSSHLAGQNQNQSASESPKADSGNSVPTREPQPPRKLTDTDRHRLARSTKVSSSAKRDSAVVPASNEEISSIQPGQLGPTIELPPSQFAPTPPSRMLPARPGVSGQTIVFPATRANPPTITGSHLNLQPGETATERSLRLLNVIAELEQQNAELADQNARLQEELKAKEALLKKGAEQFSSARKALSLDQEEFLRLRKEINDVREKFRASERENGSLMRSLSPLLKQMLQSTDDPPLKD